MGQRADEGRAGRGRRGDRLRAVARRRRAVLLDTTEPVRVQSSACRRYSGFPSQSTPLELKIWVRKASVRSPFATLPPPPPPVSAAAIAAGELQRQLAAAIREEQLAAALSASHRKRAVALREQLQRTAAQAAGISAQPLGRGPGRAR